MAPPAAVEPEDGEGSQPDRQQEGSGTQEELPVLLRQGEIEAEAEPDEDEAPPPALTQEAGAANAGEVDVPAPLLGNFYSSPRPGDPPFVNVGDRVEEDTTIAIIEVMKLMTPIRAGVAGTVVALLAENGSAVEQGQPILRVKVG